MAEREEMAPYYEQVANKLIEQLQAGTAPWQKPWAAGTLHLPHNPVSGTRYKGSNSVWLEMQGRGDPRWMTYKQAKGVGAQVRQGEKGTLVQYWKLTDQIALDPLYRVPETGLWGRWMVPGSQGFCQGAVPASRCSISLAAIRS